jgi:hypothetical protein
VGRRLEEEDAGRKKAWDRWGWDWDRRMERGGERLESAVPGGVRGGEEMEEEAAVRRKEGERLEVGVAKGSVIVVSKREVWMVSYITVRVTGTSFCMTAVPQTS